MMYPMSMMMGRRPMPQQPAAGAMPPDYFGQAFKQQPVRGGGALPPRLPALKPVASRPDYFGQMFQRPR